MKKMRGLYISLIGMVLSTYGSDEKPEANIVHTYVVNDFFFGKNALPSDLQDHIATFMVDTPIDGLTPQENIALDDELKKLHKKYPKISLTAEEKKALAVPFKQRHEKIIGMYVIAKKTQEDSTKWWDYPFDDYKYAKKLPLCIKKKFNTPEKVNVHKPRNPFKNILNRSGKGFVYGFATGLFFCFGCGYMQKRTSPEVSSLALIGGIGLGLAGGICEGTKQVVKEVNKRNLSKIKRKKL